MRRIGTRIALVLPSLGSKRLQPSGESDGSTSTATADSPFLAARTEFTNAFGDLARGKRNWQLIAFSLAGLLGLASLANLRLVTAARVVPYLVQVDRLGQVLSVGRADAAPRPDDRLLASQLAQFIRAVRTVLPTSAAAAQAELLRRAYAFVTPQAAAFLNDYFAHAAHDPRVLGQRLTREIDVGSVLRLPRSDVWQVRWTETERPVQPGASTVTRAWESYCTVAVVPPTTPEGVQDNPLGLSITALSWTPVAEGTESPRLSPDSGGTP